MRRVFAAIAFGICWGLVVAGCGGGDGAVSSTPVITAAPSEDFLTDAGSACSAASNAAYADADRLGYWDHELTADEQIEYFAGRVNQVDDLVAALSGVQPSAAFAADWATTVGYLQEYAEWAAANVVTITETGSTVDEASPESLQSFRAAFELGYGHACQDLFDMN